MFYWATRMLHVGQLQVSAPHAQRLVRILEGCTLHLDSPIWVTSIHCNTARHRIFTLKRVANALKRSKELTSPQIGSRMCARICACCGSKGIQEQSRSARAVSYYGNTPGGIR